MWIRGGYTGTGNVNDILGSLEGKIAVVAGNAEGVFEEVVSVVSKLKENPPVIFAVNDVGMFLPWVDHWATIHLQHFPQWIAVRAAHNRSPAKTHSINYGVGIDYAWCQLNPIFVLSGYFATQLAYLMGCERIVLCGCPGSPARRFFDLKPRNFGYGGGDSPVDPITQKMVVDEFERVPEFKARVRSCSGWTKGYFGVP